jgi:hypothetical protein
VSIICAVTLLRNEGPLSATGNVFWAPTGLKRFIEGLGNDSEITLNILLFTPAAAIITWRYRRPLVTILALALLSLAIELTQGLIGLGSADFCDLLSNIAGTLIGALLACTLLCFTTYRTLEIAFTEAALIGLLLLAVGGTLPLANWRQNHVRDELQSKFTGTTITVYDRWDSTGELPAKVFRMNESFSDGAVLDARQATVRFPANTLGIRRCVLATWTKQGFTTKTQSGPPCERFMG